MQAGPVPPHPEPAPPKGLMAPPGPPPVPLGGTPDGVKDDIPAKLSKGEFVVPEYAVNFYGMDYFHKLLKKAQDGLQEMHKNGLIKAPPGSLPPPDPDAGNEQDEGPTLHAPPSPGSDHLAHGGFVQSDKHQPSNNTVGSGHMIAHASQQGPGQPLGFFQGGAYDQANAQAPQWNGYSNGGYIGGSAEGYANGGYMDSPGAGYKTGGMCGYASGGMVLPAAAVGGHVPAPAAPKMTAIRNPVSFKIPHNTGIVHTGIAGPIHRDITTPKMTAHTPAVATAHMAGGGYVNGFMSTDHSGQGGDNYRSVPNQSYVPVNAGMTPATVKPQGLMAYPYN